MDYKPFLTFNKNNLSDISVHCLFFLFIRISILIVFSRVDRLDFRSSIFIIIPWCVRMSIKMRALMLLQTDSW